MRFSRNVRRFSQPLSIITCTDKLIQNDPGFVELSLERVGENFDLDDFVYALRANRTVRHVCFSGTFVRELEPAQWRRMLESIGYLETLEELQVWCSTIPVDVLSRALRNAQKLLKVYFFRVTLAGEQNDFEDLAQAIRTHPVLRDCRIGGFQTASTMDVHLFADHIQMHQQTPQGVPAGNENVNLNCVVEAFADAPCLEVVSLQLTGVQMTVPFSGSALATMFRGSKTITDLYLSRLALTREHFVVISNALSNNEPPALRILDLFGNNVENEHVMMMAKALQTNVSLETLVLPCPSDDLSLDACAAISQALQSNTTLLTLNLPRSNLTDAGLQYLAQGLTVNTTLKKIEVGFAKSVGNKGTGALIQMLEKNYELERLVVSSAEKDIKEKVLYYMRLNEVGRGSLLRDGKATREQWVEMLVSVSDDLDCLFYFITMNPALCQFANAGGADVIITEEFKSPYAISRRHTIDTTTSHYGYPPYSYWYLHPEQGTGIDSNEIDSETAKPFRGPSIQSAKSAEQTGAELHEPVHSSYYNYVAATHHANKRSENRRASAF